MGAIKGAGQGAESEGSEAGEDRVYRLFSHQGTLEKMDGGGGGGKKECRYLTSALDVEATYSQLYQSFVSSPHSLTPSPLTLLPPSLGSPLLQKVWVPLIMRMSISFELCHLMVYDRLKIP